MIRLFLSFFISTVWAAKKTPIALPVAEISEGTELAAVFPDVTWLKAAAFSPLLMILLWILKTFLEHFFGESKQIRKDVQELKVSVARIESYIQGKESKGK